MADEPEPTQTELLLTNLLDNPEDDLARGVFADYVTEYDVNNAPMVAKANLIYAQQHHGLTTPSAPSHISPRPPGEVEKALQSCNLDFGLGRRVDSQVQALRCSTYGCCSRHADQQYCRCLFDSVNADLRLGFVDVLYLEFMQVFSTDILTHALRYNPLKKLVLADAELEVEIDRWFDGPEHNGWQVYFYATVQPPHGRSDYFHMESFEFRAEVVDNITDLVRNAVLSQTFLGQNPAAPWTRPLTPEHVRQIRDAQTLNTQARTNRARRRRRGQT